MAPAIWLEASTFWSKRRLCSFVHCTRVSYNLASSARGRRPHLADSVWCLRMTFFKSWIFPLMTSLQTSEVRRYALEPQRLIVFRSTLQDWLLEVIRIPTAWTSCLHQGGGPFGNSWFHEVQRFDWACAACGFLELMRDLVTGATRAACRWEDQPGDGWFCTRKESLKEYDW